MKIHIVSEKYNFTLDIDDNVENLTIRDDEDRDEEYYSDDCPVGPLSSGKYEEKVYYAATGYTGPPPEKNEEDDNTIEEEDEKKSSPKQRYKRLKDLDDETVPQELPEIIPYYAMKRSIRGKILDGCMKCDNPLPKCEDNNYTTLDINTDECANISTDIQRMKEIINNENMPK